MPLSFNWLDIGLRSAPGAQCEDEEEESEEEDDVDDPFDLRKLAADWKITRKGGKAVTVNPGAVAVGDFVVIRAARGSEDHSCFKISGVDVPLYLCKVRRL